MSDLNGLVMIARKGGYVIVGQDKLAGYEKKLYLLLLDETAGKSLVREMNFLAHKKNIPLCIVKNLPEISKIPNCKVIGIKNKNLSDEILKVLDEVSHKN